MKLTLRFGMIALISVFTISQATSFAEDKKAPDVFKVKFETSKGDFVVEVQRKWAPIGADHFHTLIENKFYDDCRFFRVLDNFMAQFGINGDPETQKKWKKQVIKDDPVVASNTRGMITYATAGPNTRTSQLFINFGNNARLDGQGFAPFGKVIEGMDVVDKINSEYRQEPSQGKIQSEGNKYLKKEYPRLDYIKTARIVKKEKKK